MTDRAIFWLIILFILVYIIFLVWLEMRTRRKNDAMLKSNDPWFQRELDRTKDYVFDEDGDLIPPQLKGMKKVNRDK